MEAVHLLFDIQKVGKGSVPMSVRPVSVMKILWAVQGKAYQKMVLFKEVQPVVVQQQAVGLEGIGNLDTVSGQLSGFLNKLPEPADTGHGGFAALKGKGNGIAGVQLGKNVGQNFLSGLGGHNPIGGLLPDTADIRVKAVFTAHVAE